MSLAAAAPRRRASAAFSAADSRRFLGHVARGTQASASAKHRLNDQRVISDEPQRFRILLIALSPALCVLWLPAVLAITSLSHAAFSVHFDVLKSSTLEMIPTDRYPPCLHRLCPPLLISCVRLSFALHYADSTELRGFQCKDHVKFGRVTGDLSFACLYHCNSPDFNDSDGILGFGRYVNDVRLPAPLFTSLTDPSNLLPGSPQLSPKFRCARWALLLLLPPPPQPAKQRQSLALLTAPAAFCPRRERLSFKLAGK
jgi:hypothetical protein